MRDGLAVDHGRSCLVCGGEDLADLVRMPLVPAVCNRLLHDAEQARRVALAPINLVYCRRCGHLFNAAFDPALVEYGGTYENSLMGSPRYRLYTIRLIERLLSAHGLKGSTAVEIGCGRGEFLRMLCEGGFKRAIGFDPGRPAATDTVADATLTIIDSPFDAASAPPEADLICSRHVLEHLAGPGSLLRAIRMTYSSNPECVLVVEVPNGRHTVQHRVVWDLIYEHVSYFTPSSLSWILKSSGYVAERIEATFGGQFLLAEARFASSREIGAMHKPDCITAEQLGAFRAGFTTTLDAWEHWLRAAKHSELRLALWGAGAKGVTFLNLLDQSGNHAVAQVVDINPLKAGAFVAGTGHPIVAPSALRDRHPDIILLMNPEYEAEVRQMLASLDVAARLITVSDSPPPPSAVIS